MANTGFLPLVGAGVKSVGSEGSSILGDVVFAPVLCVVEPPDAVHEEVGAAPGFGVLAVVSVFELGPAGSAFGADNEFDEDEDEDADEDEDEDEFDDESDPPAGAAAAIPDPEATAVPIPRATASPPIRPMYVATPMRI